MLRFWFLRLCSIALVVLSLTNIVVAQSPAEPPARTTYTDNGAVKERWFTDASGAKNGKYIKYSRTGQVLDTYTYVHGVKDGPASYIGEYGAFNWHTPCRYVGVYNQGNKVGTWQLYLSVAGQPFSNTADVTEKFDDAGYLHIRVQREGSKTTSIFTYNKQQERSGLARFYSKVDNSVYAQGNYEADKPVGTWQNATINKDGSIIYARGCKIDFEDGVAATLTDESGKIRSLKEEARSNAALLAKYEADRQAAIAAAPKRFDRISVLGIDFTPDSYLLTVEGQATVTSVANAINERDASSEKVSVIYLSAHTEAQRRFPNDTTEKMMFILSMNRAFAVKKLLQEQIKDKSCKIIAYGCAGALPTQNGDQRGFSGDSRVQMLFDDRLPNAEAAYTKLANKYGIQMTDNIMPNSVMRRSILRTVDAYFEDDQLRQGMLDRATGKGKTQPVFYKIPRELWVQTVYSEKYGESNPLIFRTEVENRFAKWSKKYDLMSENQGKGVNPKVLFHRELEQYLAQTAN